MAQPSAASLVDAPASASPVADMSQTISDHARMKAYFDKMEKVEIKINKDRGPQFVQVNGYSFDIAAGIPVKVPKQIAQMLRDADII